MPAIIFILADGEQQIVVAEAGANVMRTALEAGVPGIIAECGGAAMCATCHVYVDPASVGLLPDIGDVEHEMLECTAAERGETSRLSCQLSMPDNAANITVRIPASQN